MRLLGNFRYHPACLVLEEGLYAFELVVEDWMQVVGKTLVWVLALFLQTRLEVLASALLTQVALRQSVEPVAERPILMQELSSGKT